MEEARDPKSAASVSDDAGKESMSASREAEATDAKTLSDLEQTRKSSEGRSNTTDDGSTSSTTPSPDGAFDEKDTGRADGSDTGGPM